MPYNLPGVFDVSALAEELVKRADTKSIGFAILQLLDAASAHADLLYARELLATIILDAKGQVDHPSPYSGAVRGALLAQVILLYARAVIVQSKRRRFDIRARLTPDQRSVHAEIDEMRDRAIAHFDRSATRHEAKWADEKVVLPADDPFRLIPAIRRMIVRPELVHTLIDQVEVALEILNDIRSDKHAVAVIALSDLFKREPRWAKQLDKYQVDVLTFLGDFQLAADMLGPGFGSAQLHESSG